MSVSLREDLIFALRHPRVRASAAVFVIAVLLGVSVGFAYWWPIVSNVDELNAAIDDRQQEIASLEYSLRLVKSSGYATRQVDLIEKKLASTFTQAALVQNLATLARQNKVRIISEAYEEGKAKSGYSTLVHEITVQARYSELRSFIAGLQNLPTFTIVQEANFSRSSNPAVIKAHLSIITYRLAEGPQT